MMERRHRRIALLVAACFFMEMLDATIVTTAAPQIAASLGASVSGISIVVTAYVVTVAALIPLSGWLAARFGGRPVFLSAIVLFALASLGCALSTSLPMLVGMRVLQGFAGALMVPVGRLIVFERTPKADLMRATAFIVWPGLIAPVIAPLVGGLITEHAGWRWIFLINLPLAAVALVFGLVMLERSTVQRPPRLDVLGVVLTCAGVAGLTAAAAILAEPSPEWLPVLVIGGASAVAIVLAVRHLLRTPAPLIDLRAFRTDTFRAAVVGISIFFLAVGAAPFMLPVLFQELFGWSPVKAGALIVVLFAGNIAIKPATTYLYGRFGFRAMLLVATVGLAVTTAAMGLMTAAMPLLLIGALLSVNGVMRSIGGTGYTTMAFVDVPPEELRDANTLQAAGMTMSMGFGAAVGAIALQVGDSLAWMLPGDPSEAAAYAIAFALVGAISLLGTVGALRLDPSAGAVLRRGRGQAAAARRAAR